MSQNIVLKKGLDIPITGEAGLVVSKAIVPGTVAIQPSEFKGLLPRLLVKEGDTVLCGSPVIADKKNADILITSPASGKVKAIVRGEKRKLLAVLIETDGEQKCADFKVSGADDAEGIRKAVLESGLWPWIVSRPYGTIADPAVKPAAIFCSAYATAPLAADIEFCFADKVKDIQAGVNALSKLTDGGVHISFGPSESSLRKIQGAVFHTFEGRHPAGNVGVQIANIRPIRKEETVWTISLMGLAAIGHLLNTGKLCLRRRVAVCGPMAIEPSYIDTLPGTPMKELAPFYGTNADEVRFISGDILSGKNAGEDGYIGFYDNQVTLIKEGRERELFGWIRPIRYKQFSTDHCYFSWLMPWRKYDMDTNLPGGPRAFLMNDSYYGKMLPMDIYPLYLVKACLAGDIDKMEKFGIYEVLPEDLALCEYVDPSKNDIQDIIAKGIDLMLKEMA